ncbi:MAG: ATP-grasp domain-containing protein [Dehalococcoidales bacterium]|nr:ATP-grasp domain-containing protein [Dehalococcoidales bacterium]
MKIGLSYDLKETFARLAAGQPEDAFEEYDSVETVEALKCAIEAGGHEVVKLGGGLKFLTRVLNTKVDFVFNISEGLGSYRSREAQVPSVLEMLDIPYSGADPQCLAVCLDKHLTKKIVSWEGIPTPKWQVVDGGKLKSIDWKSWPYPAFVKPVWEGSSKGIRLKSLVRDAGEMESTVSSLWRQYRQPVLIEEYVSGEEVTAGLVGNSPPEIIGIMRVVPRQKDSEFVYSLEVKRDYENLVDYECPAKLEKGTLQRIREYSLKAFEVLECRDFARVDFRISRSGTPYFLEINPLAGLNPRSSDLIIMARLCGIGYNELIGSILKAALERQSERSDHI